MGGALGQAELLCPCFPRLIYSEVRSLKMDGANDPRYNFDADPSLDEIIAQQGKGPVTDLSVLHGDFWPEEESIEDFLAALHEWRGHNRADSAA
jgi:hypothetical protein